MGLTESLNGCHKSDRVTSSNLADPELPKCESEQPISVVEQQTNTFFNNAFAFTYGEMSLAQAGLIIDKFSKLSRDARKIPVSYSSVENMVTPKADESKRFLEKNGLWHDSLSINEEGQELVLILSTGSKLQKFLLYTAYFHLLVRECRDLEMQGTDKKDEYAERFSKGIHAMHEDINFDQEQLPFKDWRDALDYAHENPQEVFYCALQSELLQR